MIEFETQEICLRRLGSFMSDSSNGHGSDLSDTRPIVDAIHIDEHSPAGFLLMLADKDRVVQAGWYRRSHTRVGTRPPYVIRQKFSGPFASESDALA